LSCVKFTQNRGANYARRLRRVDEKSPNAPAPDSVSHMNKMRRDLSRRPRCGHSEVCNVYKKFIFWVSPLKSSYTTEK